MATVLSPCIITKIGFTPAALNRAYYGPSDVELDILNFDELQQFQGHGAIPYAGKHGILLSAPFGWVIDARRSGSWLAVMYQQGTSLEEAINCREFMYINFWDKTTNKGSLQDLLEIQKANLLSDNKDAAISLLSTIRRDDATTVLREVLAPASTQIEYTGFVEFDEFIFFCVLHTPENVRKRNIRKLENVMSRIVKMEIRQ